MKHIVNFSGGKDSAAMLLRMIELKMPIDKIVFANTGMEHTGMIDYVKKVEKYINRKIIILNPKNSWDKWFYGTWTKGINYGKIRGFPYMISPCWATRELKVKQLDKMRKKGDISYIGIAFDEKDRTKKKLYKTGYKFPLVEWGWSELDCRQYLVSKNMLNPLYKKFNRLGCWCCPNQSLYSLQVLFQDYPKLWKKLKIYEKHSPQGFGKSLNELEEKFKNKPIDITNRKIQKTLRFY